MLRSKFVGLCWSAVFALCCTFSARAANLVVHLAPSGAVSAGAQWRVDGGVWRNSGVTVKSLSNGNHTIECKTVTGWITPAPLPVTLSGGTTTITRTYVAAASARIDLTPSSGQWRIDGGAWRASGATVAGLAPGNHTIDYFDLGGIYIPPAPETITLTAGQNLQQSRAYGIKPGNIAVTLTPSAARWRVNSGTWQASGATVSGLVAGDYTVDYETVAGYFAPPAETVTVSPNATTSLNRSYVATGTLSISATPSSILRVGALSWRVDGGGWQTGAQSVTVAAGDHTVEFQPNPAFIVPATATVTVSAGSTTTQVGEYFPVHRLRFFLNQDLVGALTMPELQARISQYAAHVQTIFHRETIRRLVFDPQTDITVCTESPFSGYYSGEIPGYGYEFWIYAQLTNLPEYGSYGGTGGLDVSGAGGSDILKWDAIHDPSTLQPNTEALRQYWVQIDHIVHEALHSMGAGMGEYYSPFYVVDNTGVEPLLPTTHWQEPGLSDHFWGPRQEYWRDPLTINIYNEPRVGSPTALPDLLAGVQLAPATRGVVASLVRFSDLVTLPDLSRTRVSLVDSVTGQPIQSATLRVWKRTDNGTGDFELSVQSTASAGVFEFNWPPYPSVVIFSNVDNMKILKAWAPGYTPKAQWEWLYDAQKAKTINNSDTFDIVIAMDPAP